MTKMMDQQNILQHFIEEQYEQIRCEKCETTFLTNVYDFSPRQVLLEKRSYGLEYFCGAIQSMNIFHIPDIHRVGVIDEDNQIVTAPEHETIYSGEEAEYRFIYIMERLEHLNDRDAAYFDRCIKDLDWQSEKDREKILQGLSKRYSPSLAEDVDKLYRYYKQHDAVIAWDLHGDNLMHRLDAGGNPDEILILDPYTRHA